MGEGTGQDSSLKIGLIKHLLTTWERRRKWRTKEV